MSNLHSGDTVVHHPSSPVSRRQSTDTSKRSSQLSGEPKTGGFPAGGSKQPANNDSGRSGPESGKALGKASVTTAAVPGGGRAQAGIMSVGEILRNVPKTEADLAEIEERQRRTQKSEMIRRRSSGRDSAHDPFAEFNKKQNPFYQNPWKSSMKRFNIRPHTADPGFRRADAIFNKRYETDKHPRNLPTGVESWGSYSSWNHPPPKTPFFHRLQHEGASPTSLLGGAGGATDPHAGIGTPSNVLNVFDGEKGGATDKGNAHAATQSTSFRQREDKLRAQIAAGGSDELKKIKRFHGAQEIKDTIESILREEKAEGHKVKLQTLDVRRAQTADQDYRKANAWFEHAPPSVSRYYARRLQCMVAENRKKAERKRRRSQTATAHQSDPKKEQNPSLAAGQNQSLASVQSQSAPPFGFAPIHSTQAAHNQGNPPPSVAQSVAKVQFQSGQPKSASPRTSPRTRLPRTLAGGQASAPARGHSSPQVDEEAQTLFSNLALNFFYEYIFSSMFDDFEDFRTLDALDLWAARDRSCVERGNCWDQGPLPEEKLMFYLTAFDRLGEKSRVRPNSVGGFLNLVHNDRVAEFNALKIDPYACPRAHLVATPFGLNYDALREKKIPLYKGGNVRYTNDNSDEYLYGDKVLQSDTLGREYWFSVLSKPKVALLGMLDDFLDDEVEINTRPRLCDTIRDVERPGSAASSKSLKTFRSSRSIENSKRLTLPRLAADDDLFATPEGQSDSDLEDLSGLAMLQAAERRVKAMKLWSTVMNGDQRDAGEIEMEGIGAANKKGVMHAVREGLLELVDLKQRSIPGRRGTFLEHDEDVGTRSVEVVKKSDKLGKQNAEMMADLRAYRAKHARDEEWERLKKSGGPFSAVEKAALKGARLRTISSGGVRPGGPPLREGPYEEGVTLTGALASNSKTTSQSKHTKNVFADIITLDEKKVVAETIQRARNMKKDPHALRKKAFNDAIGNKFVNATREQELHFGNTIQIRTLDSADLKKIWNRMQRTWVANKIYSIEEMRASSKAVRTYRKRARDQLRIWAYESALGLRDLAADRDLITKMLGPVRLAQVRNKSLKLMLACRRHLLEAYADMEGLTEEEGPRAGKRRWSLFNMFRKAQTDVEANAEVAFQEPMTITKSASLSGMRGSISGSMPGGQTSTTTPPSPSPKRMQMNFADMGKGETTGFDGGRKANNPETAAGYDSSLTTDGRDGSGKKDEDPNLKPSRAAMMNLSRAAYLDVNLKGVAVSPGLGTSQFAAPRANNIDIDVQVDVKEEYADRIRELHANQRQPARVANKKAAFHMIVPAGVSDNVNIAARMGEAIDREFEVEAQTKHASESTTMRANMKIKQKPPKPYKRALEYKVI